MNNTGRVYVQKVKTFPGESGFVIPTKDNIVNRRHDIIIYKGQNVHIYAEPDRNYENVVNGTTPISSGGGTIPFPLNPGSNPNPVISPNTSPVSNPGPTNTPFPVSAPGSGPNPGNQVLPASGGPTVISGPSGIGPSSLGNGGGNQILPAPTPAQTQTINIFPGSPFSGSSYTPIGTLPQQALNLGPTLTPTLDPGTAQTTTPATSIDTSLNPAGGGFGGGGGALDPGMDPGTETDSPDYKKYLWIAGGIVAAIFIYKEFIQAKK